MTIYIDDSGTRPENAVAVAAGWMADTDSWVDFQADWDKASDIDGDKFDSMHMAEFVFGRRGTEFEGWSLEKKQRISARLRGMIDTWRQKEKVTESIEYIFDWMDPGDPRRKEIGAVFGPAEGEPEALRCYGLGKGGLLV